MKVQMKVSPKIIIDINADEMTTVFEEIANAQEILGICECGKCKSQNIRYVVREDSEANKYYEMRCQDCFAKIAFGLNKKGGGMFPKLKENTDEDKCLMGGAVQPGAYLPDKGWLKWDKEKNCNV